MPASCSPEEVEFKLGVSGPRALEAMAVAAEARGARRAPPQRQLNHFFDTADRRLSRDDRVLRLREEGGDACLAAKGPRVPGTDPELHSRAEHERRVTAARAREVLQGRTCPLALLIELTDSDVELLNSIVEAVDGVALMAVGSFENERVVLGPLPAGEVNLALELDRTLLPGGRVDCEVELEVPAHAVEQGRLLLQGLLLEAGVEGRPCASKAARFFEALQAGGERCD